MDLSNAPKSESYTLHHSVLGEITGHIAPDIPDVVQFRAIPYATIPGRFEHSILRESLDGLSKDFTTPGFACPHSYTFQDPTSGGPIPGEKPIKASELECLILQINVPLSHLETLDVKRGFSKHLPVLTYIHGGGFVLGKIDAQHNTAHMAHHSISIGQPVVATSLQYRLGPLGYMSTPDGTKNIAIFDQRNALLWAQKFIEGFGGDKDRVTVFGESAGAASICCHMMSHVPSSGPLFHRVILMSGIFGPMISALDEEKSLQAFEGLCSVLGIESKGQEALEQLKALDVEKLIEASIKWTSPGIMYSPVVQDDNLLREKVVWDKVPELLGKCEWVDEIVFGTTGFEGAPNLALANSLTPERFYEHLKINLSDKAADEVMKAYGVRLGMDQNLFVTSALRWTGDIVFNAPTQAFARHIAHVDNKRVYRYVFDVRNPFPNAPCYQQSHHWVDIYFVFRTLQFRYPDQYLKDISDKHAQFWIEFANGKAPWTPYRGKDEAQRIVMIADEKDGWVERTVEYQERLNTSKFATLDKLLDAWSEKKGQWWKPLDMAALNPPKPQ